MHFHTFLLVPLTLLACSRKAPDSESAIPEKITAAFKKEFPGAKKLYWEREETDFEAQFLMDGKEMSAVYDRSGNLWEIEETINIAELPSAAVSYIREKSPGSAISEASKITLKPEKVLYEAEVDGNDLLFSENGTFLKMGRN